MTRKPTIYAAYVVLDGDDAPTKWAESDNRKWMQAIVDHKTSAGLQAEVREVDENQGGTR